MNIYFSNDVFKEKALLTTHVNYENNITSADAFFIVLKGLDYDMMDNLCEEVKKELCFKDSYKIYELIQNDGCNYELKKIILDIAYDLIHSNKEIGSKVVNGGFNASSWISHSLYEGELAASLASLINLDSETAKKLGILHDIGRKFNHSFMHTIKGYEYLLLKGLKDEAVCTLTHSFLPIEENGILRGNRCANCEPATLGFYIDEHGNGVFSEDTDKDDITLFLDSYRYNRYDVILNISDLMAMSSGITSPYERVKDIYTRKIPDSKNSPFFKVCLINTLRKYMYSVTHEDKYIELYNITNISDIESIFINTSNEFMQIYNNLVNNNSKTMK